MDADHIMARVLHRDANLLVLDKPAGIPVHAGRGAAVETVGDWLDALRFGLPKAPELAHRLDRDTSGCLVLGRHRQALIRLADLFKANEVAKTYWAIVEGGPPADEGTIDLPLARRSPDPRNWQMRADPSGKPALTRWRVLGREAGRAWLELSPETGRTHQLRVHCAASGWPIAGDRIYGTSAPGDGLRLHARRVAIPFRRNRPPVTAEAEPPADFAAELAAFR